MSETPHVPPPSEGPIHPPPAPAGGGVAGGSRDTAMLVLSYLWFRRSSLVVKKEDEVQWHAKNGLILAIATQALNYLLGDRALLPAGGCLTLWLPASSSSVHHRHRDGHPKATSGQRSCSDAQRLR